MGLACAGFCNYLEQVDADQAHLQKQILFKKVEPSGTKTLYISVSPVLRSPVNQKVSGLLGEIDCCWYTVNKRATSAHCVPAPVFSL